MNANTKKYISGFIFFGILSVIIKQIRNKFKDTDEKQYYDLVDQYLLHTPPQTKLPIIWVHIDYETNARKWINFGSRNTKQLNQPYLYLVLQSIINQCENEFKICFVDDNSFYSLLPNWTIDMNKLSCKTHVRHIGLLKLLYHYGGILVPKGFLCLRSLSCLHKYDSVFTIHANPHFIGSPKQSKILFEYIQKLEFHAHKHFFSDTSKDILNEYITNNQVINISGKQSGEVDINGNKIYMEDLFSNKDISFLPDMIGVLIPTDELLKRTKYNWFSYISIQDALMTHTNVSALLQLTCSSSK